MSETVICKYNSAVDCAPMNHKCSRCGWNPPVSKERIKNRAQTDNPGAVKLKERFIAIHESNEDGVDSVLTFKTLKEASDYIADSSRAAYDHLDYDEAILDIAPMFAYIEDGDHRESWSIHRVAV